MKKVKDLLFPKPNVTKAVQIVIDRMRDGEEITGWELRNRCVKLNPELAHTYVETFLRLMRMNRRAEMVCTDRAKSKYMKWSNR